MNIISLTLISILVGFLGSLTGLGGASILIPLLVLFGVPVKIAIASAMVCIIATSSGSASSYVREKITNIRIAMFLEMFTMTGAIVGASITTFIHPTYLYFFFAAFLLTSFLSLRRRRRFNGLKEAAPDRLSRWLNLKGSYYDQAEKKVVDYHATNALPGGFGMVVAGVAAGMLGIGAGAFKVTVQENILKLPAKVSSATSNFIIGMTALAATSVYLFSGYLNLSLMAPMAVGTTIGAIIGGRTLNRLNTRVLRVLFFLIITFLIIQMLYKGIISL
jgi:uncharacterized membrane protein YfcA